MSTVRHEDGRLCIWGWDDGNGGHSHCDGCCPQCIAGEDCERVPVECERCKNEVPQSEANNTEAGWYCHNCERATEKEWEAYFGGPEAIKRRLADERFYREEGLLRPDGTYDIEALRRLK